PDLTQDLVDNPPGGLDGVLAGERKRITLERGRKKSGVRPLVHAGLARERELLQLRSPARSRLLAREAKPCLRVRPNPEPQLIRATDVETEDVVRGATEPDDHLSRRNGQRFAGSDGDWYLSPSPGVKNGPSSNVGLRR